MASNFNIPVNITVQIRPITKIKNIARKNKNPRINQNHPEGFFAYTYGKFQDFRELYFSIPIHG